MAQVTLQPTWALLTKPTGYPSGPAVGKPEMLLNTNASALYHKFSPYSNYSQNGGLLNWGDQPFYYVYIDQANDFPNNRAVQTPVFPLQDSVIDVQRVSKFLASGTGITFLANQFFLQTGNAFDETRIYNPTSPIVAAGMGLTFNAVRPERFIDIDNGIAGVATSLLGGVGSLLGGGAVSPPKSTTGRGALPTVNVATDGKGLIRGGDANKGLANFTSKWAPSQGGTNTFMSMVSSIASSLFGNFLPARQTGITYRSDEGSYGMMIAGASPRFDYTGDNGDTFKFGQLWVAGEVYGTMRKVGEYSNSPVRLFVQATNGVITTAQVSVNGGLSGYISHVGTVGYTIDSTVGYSYEDTMNPSKNKDEFEGSDVMYQYKYYADNSQLFPTKDPESTIADDTDKVKTSLDKILSNIKDASGGIYDNVTPDGTIFRKSSIQYNYSRLFQTKDKQPGQSAKNYPLSSLRAYRNSGVKLVSDDIAVNGKSLGLPTAGYPDTINTLGVLDSSQRGTGPGMWSPFDDDLVALYFYDVVNDKYIPFRAAVSGISETGNSSWEEMPFIGRADKVYSYGGFTRNLSLTIKVVINSLKELAPTWQRINYLLTSYKPANYTKAASSIPGNLIYDRFVVPPMFMLTLGDMYRDQPILIQSVTLTVPDDAAWETLNSDNSGTTWNYMANTIQSTGATFGQIPREVQLGVSAYLLEKERAVVGGANFGHAPRSEDFSGWNYDTAQSDIVTKWSSNLVVSLPNLKPSAIPSIPIPGSTSF